MFGGIVDAEGTFYALHDLRRIHGHYCSECLHIRDCRSTPDWNCGHGRTCLVYETYGQAIAAAEALIETAKVVDGDA